MGLPKARAIGRKRAAQQRERMLRRPNPSAVQARPERQPERTSSHSAGFSKDYDDKGRGKTVQRYASMSVTKLTLGQMMQYGEEMTEGKLIKSARRGRRLRFWRRARGSWTWW